MDRSNKFLLSAFFVCSTLLFNHVFGMDLESGELAELSNALARLELSENKDEYVFAKQFLTLVMDGIQDFENLGTTTKHEIAQKFVDVLGQIELGCFSDVSSPLDVKDLVDFYANIKFSTSLSSKPKKIVNERVLLLLEGNKLHARTIRALLICFLDTYDEHFKSLPIKKKYEFETHILVRRVLDVCERPATLSEKFFLATTASDVPVRCAQKTAVLGSVPLLFFLLCAALTGLSNTAHSTFILLPYEAAVILLLTGLVIIKNVINYSNAETIS